MSQKTIEVTLKVPIADDSNLRGVLSSYVEVMLKVTFHRRQVIPIPESLKVQFEETQKAVKAALTAKFGFSFPIENIVLDTEHFLSHAEHCAILAPEG